MEEKTKRFIEHRFPLTFLVLKKNYLRYKQLRSKFFIKRLIKNSKQIFVEAGAGNIAGKNGWVTIDMRKKCDIFWDLSKGIPFPENSVNKIYSSHFLEHLTFGEGQKFLQSCIKSMVSGGSFSVCVPNANLFIQAYLDSKVSGKKQLKPAIEHINHIAYMGGEHKYMFDEENLVSILKAIGFSKVATRKFDPTLDLKERDCESIYVEAIK